MQFAASLSLLCLGCVLGARLPAPPFLRFGLLKAKGDISDNPICFSDTGHSCKDGSGCEQFVQCNPDAKCICPKWGCADQAGHCRPVWSQWEPDEYRMGTAIMPGQFVSMSQQGDFSVTKTYPHDGMPMGVWEFLLQSDNVTVMITTKQSRHEADGLFLDLPPQPSNCEDPSMKEACVCTKFVTPIRSKPANALQAAWVIEPAPRNRQRLRHVATNRYLMVEHNKPQGVNLKHAAAVKENPAVVTSCLASKCLPGAADFDIWPKTEHAMVKPMFNEQGGPKAKWE